jgi:hypothetical protein
MEGARRSTWIVKQNTLAGKVKYTMGQLCDMYLTDELPTLAHSTQQTNGSMGPSSHQAEVGEYPARGYKCARRQRLAR